MKVSKHQHSCLLVEDQEQIFLIDPGNYTYDEKALYIDGLSRLDYILFTHEHADHFYLPFLKKLLAKFPSAKIITNKTIVELLAKENIAATAENDEHITLTAVPHEKIWMGPAPENVMITINNKLSSPGDSLTFTSNRHSGDEHSEDFRISTNISESKNGRLWTSLQTESSVRGQDDESGIQILALPIQAPWGDSTWAVETALKVKPKTIIPIHDYHWKDTVRKAMYDRLEQYFAQYAIQFLKPETGQIFEL